MDAASDRSPACSRAGSRARRRKRWPTLGEPELVRSRAGLACGNLRPRSEATDAEIWSRRGRSTGPMILMLAAPIHMRRRRRETRRRCFQGSMAGRILFSGEALYRGRDMGTVEAALASGLETARTLLG